MQHFTIHAYKTCGCITRNLYFFRRLDDNKIIYNLPDDREGFACRPRRRTDRRASDPLHVAVENADRLLGAVATQCVDDGAVIGIGAPFPPCPPGGKQEAGARCVQPIDDLYQARHLARCRDQPVEPSIGLFPTANIKGAVTFPRRRLRLIQNCRRHVGNGMAKGENFKSGPHFRHLPHIGKTEIRHANATPGNADRQPLRLQSPKSLANRHMRSAEFLGNMILSQPLTGRKFSAHDAIGQRAADFCGDGVFRFGFRCFGHDLT